MFDRIPRAVVAVRAFLIRGTNAAAWRCVRLLTVPCLVLAWLCRRTVGRRAVVIAVAGSYGKTTTTRAIRHLFGLPASTWVDANANCFGLVGIALLRGLLQSRVVVVEIGTARPGQMARYAAALRPSIVVVTCIGSEHVQAYRDIDHLRDEEAVIVRGLPADATAVLSADDPRVASMAGETRARVVTFGTGRDADVRAGGFTVDWPQGTRFDVTIAGDTHPVATAVVGAEMARCVLAALAAVVAADRAVAHAIRVAAEFTPTRGRLEPRPLPGGAVILRDDYKSTVDTVVAALDVLAGVPAGRRIVVLGDLDMPPPPERAWYRAIGEQAGRVADEVVLVGRKHEHYRAALRRGGLADDRIRRVRTVAEAAKELSGRLGPGDVVLVKGRETQRLTRVILALEGRRVDCGVESCRMHLTSCDECPLLAAGWVGRIEAAEA